MKQFSLLLILFSIVCAGCSEVGSGVEEQAEVSGTVIDLDGNLVQNAVVTCRDQTTSSNTSGAFVLRNLPEGVWTVKAQASPNADGVTWSAQSNAQVFQNERSKNVNLTLVRQDQQATVHGIVRDRFGFIIQGAHVFAFIESGGAQLGSVQDVTNGLGEFELKSLAAGYTYIINGSARGFSSDRATVVLTAGESRNWDIVVGDAADPLLSAPANLSAVAWTSPREGLRGPINPAVYENLKRIVDPTRVSRRGPGDTTINGNHVEVDLDWDWPTSNMQYLLGYGIYRATTSNGSSTGIDFLRDPETNFFADLADELIENRNYYYEITALNVNYPDTFNSESDYSDRVGATTLADLFTNPVTQGPVTFHWQSGSGATEFYVYLFNEFPTIGVTDVWHNTVAGVGTSLLYTGPSLQSGHRYYYMVLGMANGGDSRTISELGDFVAN